MKIVPSIASITIILVLVYALTFKSFITLNYFVNQAEITQLFCVNKEKPKLHCKGKCHLTKKLIKTENKNSDLPFAPGSNERNLDLIFNIEATTKNVFIPLTRGKYKSYISLFRAITSIEIPTPPPKV